MTALTMDINRDGGHTLKSLQSLGKRIPSIPASRKGRNLGHQLTRRLLGGIAKIKKDLGLQ